MNNGINPSLQDMNPSLQMPYIEPSPSQQNPIIGPPQDQNFGFINPNVTNTSFGASDTPQKWIPQFQNGRVITTGSMDNLKPFDLIPNNNDANNTFKCEAVKSILVKNKLNQAFFSKRNIDRIQNLIRYQVYMNTKDHYIVGKQSVIDIEVIMRSIYLQHGKNLPYDICKQVDELNMWVVEIIVPRVITEVEQYMGYRRDIEQLPTPIALPQNLSSAGTKTLRSVTTTF